MGLAVLLVFDVKYGQRRGADQVGGRREVALVGRRLPTFLLPLLLLLHHHHLFLLLLLILILVVVSSVNKDADV